MKDFGLADVILRVKIIRDSSGIKLSHSHYIENVLKIFNQFDSNPARTPFDPNCKLKKNKGTGVSQLEYSKIIGYLMYIMNCTRSDIAYAVGRLSRYTCNPGHDYWVALVRVLRYLKFTLNYSLHYVPCPATLEGCTDANWISDSEESKSTNGYVFTLAGAAVSWNSSKQTCIVRSTFEFEFVAPDKAGEEGKWLRTFLGDIPFCPKPVPTVYIHCDCRVAIAKASNNTYNGKSKHIRHKHNSSKQLISNGVIFVDFVKS